MAGIKAGMSPLPSGRQHHVIPYSMWVPIAVRLTVNSYTPFPLLSLLLFYLLLLLHPFNGLVFCRTIWVSRYQKGKTSLDLNKARDDGVSGCSGISWTICKQSAPRSRQITTPTPHQSIFIGRVLFLASNQQCQSTEGTASIFSEVKHDKVSDALMHVPVALS